MSKIGTENSTKKGTLKKKRLTKLERRQKLKELLLTEGLSINQMAKRIGCNRKTASDDINVLIADVEFWLQNHSSFAWLQTLKDMFLQTNEEISELRKRALQAESDAGYTFIQNCITAKRNFQINMMTQIPLYQKLQRLARFYEQHKDDVPKEEVALIAK